MDKRENQPLQEELRSSQVYRTLKSSGIPMAGKLAEGLGKAAQGLDQALNLGKNGGPGPGGHPYQAPRHRGWAKRPSRDPGLGRRSRCGRRGIRRRPREALHPRMGQSRPMAITAIPIPRASPSRRPPPSRQRPRELRRRKGRQPRSMRRPTKPLPPSGRRQTGRGRLPGRGRLSPRVLGSRL